jgi:hypothetical protein
VKKAPLALQARGEAEGLRKFKVPGSKFKEKDGLVHIET